MDSVPKDERKTACPNIVRKKNVIRLVVGKLSSSSKTYRIHNEVDVIGTTTMDTKDNLKFVSIEITNMISQRQQFSNIVNSL